MLPIPAALAKVPWGIVLKAGALVVAFAIGFGSGCSVQAERDQKKINDQIELATKAAALAAHNAAQAQVLANQLSDIDKATKAIKAAAEARVKAAQAEAKAAAAETVEALKKAGKVESELAKAMRDPDCAKLMRTQSCAAFR